jgi:hypothetical protein
MPKNNISIIKKGVKAAAPRLFVQELRTITARAFQSEKNKMIAEFLSHPITVEIQGGPSSGNFSGTLDGKGNLFSFIGFDAGSDPINPILEILYSTDIRFVKITAVGIESVITMPTADEIFAATPMPWADGRSWAHGIESGISGLGWYIYKRGLGRSGGGIQTPDQLTGSIRFKNTKYISDLINRYQKTFRAL